MATRTLRTDKNLVVVTDLSDGEAAAIITGSATRHQFGMKLVSDWQRFRGLTPNKLAWLHKIANELIAAEMGGDEPTAPAASDDHDYKALFGLFRRAEKLKWPTITFEYDGGRLQLVYRREGKYANTISVSSGPRSQGGQWYGSIGADGRFTRANRYPVPAEAEALLLDICCDPHGAVVKYGKKTGRCCFCSTALTDAVSVFFGYGGTCAKHYGLPHGVTAARASGMGDCVAASAPAEESVFASDLGWRAGDWKAGVSYNGKHYGHGVSTTDGEGELVCVTYAADDGSKLVVLND